MADLSPEIEQSAKDPKRVTVDGNSAENQPLSEQIEADRYLEAKKAVKRKDRGLQITKLKPPGSI